MKKNTMKKLVSIFGTAALTAVLSLSAFAGCSALPSSAEIAAKVAVSKACETTGSCGKESAEAVCENILEAVKGCTGEENGADNSGTRNQVCSVIEEIQANGAGTCNKANTEKIVNILTENGCDENCRKQIETILNQYIAEKGEKCADGSCETGNTETAAPENKEEAPEESTKPEASETVTDSQPAENTNTSASSVQEYEKEVVRLVNEIRVSNGLGELTLNEKLCEVARTKSQDMLDNGYFSHTSPTYGSPFDMMKSFGISYNTAGENIAMGYATPEAVVDGWMNSEGHRANILNASFTEIGVGYVANGNYWTQMFIG